MSRKEKQKRKGAWEVKEKKKGKTENKKEGNKQDRSHIQIFRVGRH